MIQKFLKDLKEKKQKAENLKKAKAYYETCKAGALFLQFIQRDLANHTNANLNRQMRRKFEKYMADTGKLNPEIVQHYSAKVDEILAFIKSGQANKTK